jgi:DNA polymerase-3 subunit gamma/tau
VVEGIKAKGRVAAIVIGNASVASFDEGVLTLRFPRQGDVKGFQGGKYEELLKQAIAAMFGVNVVIRAVTGGGDAPSAARRPGQPPPGQPSPDGQASGPSRVVPPDYPPDATIAATGAAVPGAAPTTGNAHRQGPGNAATAGSPGGSAGFGTGGGTPSFGGSVSAGGDRPPLPPPPSPDDEDFDPDDEDMSASAVNELTGMALIQRELGAQIIAEFDD